MRFWIALVLLLGLSVANSSPSEFNRRLCSNSVICVRESYIQATALWPHSNTFPETLTKSSQLLSCVGNFIEHCLHDDHAQIVSDFQEASAFLDHTTVELVEGRIYLNGDDITTDIIESISTQTDTHQTSQNKCIFDLANIGRDILKIKNGNFSVLLLRNLVNSCKDFTNNCLGKL